MDPDGGARSKHTPRTGPSTPWMALPLGCIAGSQEHRHHYFATRTTPLNTCRILQRSTKGVT